MVAERLRTAISDEPFICSAVGGSLSITTSIGGALIDPEKHKVDEVLKRADVCLYQAKQTGRNCCVFEIVGKLDPVRYKEQVRQSID
jgi:diguanylate cyclase (GGDEF)-like protein